MESLVQGTNDSSIVSKLSMVHRGYFVDEFIQYFSAKCTRRAPLINIGYYVRSLVVHSAIKHYLDANYQQVLSLGAGFDTTYFRLGAGYKNLNYFEVDLDDVVKNKIACIKGCDKLLEMLVNVDEISDPIGLSSDRFTIFAQDLYDLEMLGQILPRLGVDFDKPTLIFSECAITYMEENKSNELIKWCSEKFKNAIFINYEQINPDDGFGQVMKRYFVKIQSPLKSLNTYKIPSQQEKRYLKCGWTVSRSVLAMKVFDTISKSREFFRLEPFDEWEEWHLKCTHYTLSIATNSLENFPPFFAKCLEKDESSKKVHIESMNEIQVNRFAHCSFMTGKHIYILGGFGLADNRHIRVKEILVINLITKQSKYIAIKSTVVLSSLYSSCAAINEKQFIIYGGRTSPLKSVNESPYLISVENDSLQIKEIHVKSDLPKPRWRHSCLSLNDSLILFGGRTSDLQILGDCWKLNLESSNFFCEELYPIDIHPSERFSHATTSKNGIIYLSGGLDKNFEPLKDIWKMQIKVSDGKTHSHWEKIDAEIPPRYGHTMHMSSKYLIFLGGVNKCISQPVCTLLHLNSLIVENVTFLIPDPYFMFHNHTSEMSEEDNAIYILGGGGNCFSFGTSLNEHPLKVSISDLLPKV